VVSDSTRSVGEMNRVVAVGFLLLVSFLVGGVRGEPFLVWNKTYDAAGNSVVPSGDGGFVISGYTYTPGVSSSDAYLVKIDSEGDEVWEHTYGRWEGDMFIGEVDLGFSKALVQSGDGGFVTAGRANIPMSDPHHVAVYDMYLWKVDRNGNKVWEKIYDSSTAYCLTQSGDGGFIVGGSLHVVGGLGTVLYVMKIDSEGNKVWDEAYPYGKSLARDITESGDGGYVLVGSGDSEQYILVLKIDSEGNKVWGKTYAGPDYDAQAVTRGSEGYIVAGCKNNVEGSLDALYLLGLDQDGNVTWERTYIDEHSYRANEIVPSGDRFVVAGSYWGRLYFLEIDDRGNKVWDETIPYIRKATSITEVGDKAGDGGFIFTSWKDFFVGKIRDTPHPIPETPSGVLWLGTMAVVLIVGLSCRDR
jgi:hypothetical protein